MTHIYLGTIIPLIHYWDAEGFITKGTKKNTIPTTFKTRAGTSRAKPQDSKLPGYLPGTPKAWNLKEAKTKNAPCAHLRCGTYK